MKFVDPVDIPGCARIRLAEDQPEYQAITVLGLRHSAYGSPRLDGLNLMVAAIEFTPEELAELARHGGKLYIGELTFGQPFTPLSVWVGDEALKRDIVLPERGDDATG